MEQKDTGLMPKGRHFGLQFLNRVWGMIRWLAVKMKPAELLNRGQQPRKDTSVDKEMKREFRNNERIPIRKRRKDTSVPKEKVSHDRINKKEERIMIAKEG
jgi:hypothetical protein